MGSLWAAESADYKLQHFLRYFYLNLTIKDKTENFTEINPQVHCQGLLENILQGRYSDYRDLNSRNPTSHTGGGEGPVTR